MKFNRFINEAREQVSQWMDYVRRDKDLSAAVNVLKKINKAGYKAYIVGGAVRDIILGMDPKDIDIATNAPMEELEKMFNTYDIGKSKDFGIVVVREGGRNFEVAQFRSDGKYSDGRRPDSVKVAGSFEKDAARRDFTINAMGINASGQILDYFDGKKAIQNKVLKTVGDPKQRFGEDYLRMVRAARFASKLGFGIEKDTEKAAKNLSKNILDLAPERIKDEIMKAASQSGDKFASFIQYLDKLKILKYILPEVVNLKYFKHNLKHHPEGDVWQHTMAALHASDTDDPIKNLAILLHDVGKGVTLSHKGGLPRYLGHAKMGVNLVNDIADRLKMSNKERQALLFAVGNHMKFHKILEMKPSKVARLIANDNWDVLVSVAQADERSRGNTFMHAGEFEKIVDKAVKIKEKYDSRTLDNRLKLVDGNHVMNLTGLKPGPKVGEIIRKTTEWILDNDIKSQDDIDKYIMDMVK